MLIRPDRKADEWLSRQEVAGRAALVLTSDQLSEGLPEDAANTDYYVPLPEYIHWRWFRRNHGRTAALPRHYRVLTCSFDDVLKPVLGWHPVADNILSAWREHSDAKSPETHRLISVLAADWLKRRGYQGVRIAVPAAREDAKQHLDQVLGALKVATVAGVPVILPSVRAKSDLRLRQLPMQRPPAQALTSPPGSRCCDTPPVCGETVVVDTNRLTHHTDDGGPRRVVPTLVRFELAKHSVWKDDNATWFGRLEALAKQVEPRRIEFHDESSQEVVYHLAKEWHLDAWSAEGRAKSPGVTDHVLVASALQEHLHDQRRPVRRVDSGDGRVRSAMAWWGVPAFS